MKNNIDVEICTFSLESCLNAQLAGASRVELCSGMYDGDNPFRGHDSYGPGKVVHTTLRDDSP